MSATVAYNLAHTYGRFQVNNQSFEKATTLLALTNSYVSSYAELRQSKTGDDLPVPASFRAQALSHFKQTSPSHIWVTNSMVGLPGKEIATSATDASMKALLMKMAASDTFDVETETLIKNGQSIHRTLFPTLAVNQGCADCHNSIQNKSSSDLWKTGDLMGAYVVDRYIDPGLALVKRTSLLGALLAAFCTVTLLMAGNYFFAQRQLADQLKTLAATDPLTGCINRREMSKRIKSMTSGASGALMMIDLDHFKDI